MQALITRLMSNGSDSIYEYQSLINQIKNTPYIWKDTKDKLDAVRLLLEASKKLPDSDATLDFIVTQTTSNSNAKLPAEAKVYTFKFAETNSYLWSK